MVSEEPQQPGASHPYTYTLIIQIGLSLKSSKVLWKSHSAFLKLYVSLKCTLKLIFLVKKYISNIFPNMKVLTYCLLTDHFDVFYDH